MGSGGKKGRGEGVSRELRPFFPYSPPSIQCFFSYTNFLRVAPLSDLLEKATKYVFKSAR